MRKPFRRHRREQGKVQLEPPVHHVAEPRRPVSRVLRASSGFHRKRVTPLTLPAHGSSWLIHFG